MPAQQGSWIATAYLETGTIAKGQVACLNEAGTRYVVASDTNRTAAGRRSACIAITAGDADDPGGSSFEAQYVGAVPPSITGLGAGTESLIRVSDAGVLERVAEYSTSDDVCGHCDADGTAYVCFPLVGLGSALGASSAPGLPDHSVQYYYDANTLGGATGVSIDGTGSALQLGTGTFATVGLVRLPYNTGTVVAVRDGGGTDRAIITSSTQLTFGSLAGYITNVEGTGLVLRANSGGRLVVNSNILEFRDGSSNFVFSFDMPNALFQTACVRFGAGTAWGASEGEVTISSTGTVTVSNVQYNQLSQKFSGASGGTYTYPAPANSGYSYIKLLEETGGADKTITIGSGTTYTLAAYTRRIVKFTPTGVFEIGASTTNYRKDVVGAGSSLGYIDLTVSGKDATTLNINLTSGSGDCDGFAHDLVDPQTMVLTVIITLNGGGAEGGGSGTFTFNALAGATAKYMIRDFDGSSNDIVIGLNSVIQFVWDGNGWRLISSVAL